MKISTQKTRDYVPQNPCGCALQTGGITLQRVEDFMCIEAELK